MSERTLPELLDALILKHHEAATIGRTGWVSMGIDQHGNRTFSEGTYSDPLPEYQSVRAEIIARFNTPAPDPDATDA